MLYRETEAAVLSILHSADCPVYTLERLIRTTHPDNPPASGSVFVALHRLEAAGYVRSYSSTKSGRRIYVCTQEGRQYYASQINDEADAERAEPASSRLLRGMGAVQDYH